MQQNVGNLVVNISANPMGLSAGLMSAERMLERTGTRMYFLGQRIALGFSLPIAALVGSVAKIGMSFDQAMTESLAIMDGVTPKIRKSMEDVAKAVAESGKFSATEAAQGYYHLASAGYTASESMDLLPVAAKFAQAGVMDLAKATEYLAGVQQAMGMRSKDASENLANMTRVSDVLTAANNKALGTIEDFAKALTNKAGAQLRLFHKDIEEGTAVLMAYASQNIKGAAAGTQFMMFQRDMARYAAKNEAAFRKYNIAVYDGTGAMRNYADIIKDFERATAGKSDLWLTKMFKELGLSDRAKHATQALFGMSSQIRAWEADLRAAGGTTEEVANKQMQALTNQVKRAWHEVQNAALVLFAEFAPAITDYVIPALEKFGHLLQVVAGYVRELPNPIKMLILAIAGIGAIIGPVIMYFGSWLLMFRGISGPIALATKELQAFTLAQAAAAGVKIPPVTILGGGRAGATRAVEASALATKQVLASGIAKPLSEVQLANAIKRAESEGRRLTAVLNRETERAAAELTRSAGSMSRTIAKETTRMARSVGEGTVDLVKAVEKEADEAIRLVGQETTSMVSRLQRATMRTIQTMIGRPLGATETAGLPGIQMEIETKALEAARAAMQAAQKEAGKLAESVGSAVAERQIAQVGLSAAINARTQALVEAAKKAKAITAGTATEAVQIEREASAKVEAIWAQAVARSTAIREAAASKIAGIELGQTTKIAEVEAQKATMLLQVEKDLAEKLTALEAERVAKATRLAEETGAKVAGITAENARKAAAVEAEIATKTAEISADMAQKATLAARSMSMLTKVGEGLLGVTRALLTPSTLFLNILIEMPFALRESLGSWREVGYFYEGLFPLVGGLIGLFKQLQDSIGLPEIKLGSFSSWVGGLKALVSSERDWINTQRDLNGQLIAEIGRGSESMFQDLGVMIRNWVTDIQQATGGLILWLQSKWPKVFGYPQLATSDIARDYGPGAGTGQKPGMLEQTLRQIFPGAGTLGADWYLAKFLRGEKSLSDMPWDAAEMLSLEANSKNQLGQLKELIGAFRSANSLWDTFIKERDRRLKAVGALQKFTPQDVWKISGMSLDEMRKHQAGLRKLVEDEEAGITGKPIGGTKTPKPWEEMADSWRNSGKVFDTITAAWSSLSDAEKKNSDVTTKAGDSWQNLRKQLAPELFDAIHRAATETLSGKEAGGLLAKVLGTGVTPKQFEAMVAMERLVQGTNDAADAQMRLDEEIKRGEAFWGKYGAGLEGYNKDAWGILENSDLLGKQFEKLGTIPFDWIVQHKNALEDLSLHYTGTDETILKLIDRYRLLGREGYFSQEQLARGAKDAEDALRNVEGTLSAKTADIQAQMSLFGEGYKSKELRGMKLNLNQQAEQYRKTFDKLWTEDLPKIMNNPQLKNAYKMEWFQRLQEAEKNVPILLSLEERLNLLRLAEQAGFTQKSLKNYAEWSKVAIDELLRVYRAALIAGGMPADVVDEIMAKTRVNIDRNIKKGNEELKKRLEILATWKENVKWVGEMTNAVGYLAEALDALGASGWANALKKAQSSMQNIASGFTTLFEGWATGDWSKMISGAMQAFAGNVQAVAAMQNTKGAGKRSAIGAMSFGTTGAMIGTMIAPGIGTAIGFGLGALAGAIAGAVMHNPMWAQIQDRLKSQGEVIGEQLAQQIEADAKALFYGDMASAEMYNIAKRIEEAGGITTQNFSTWATKLRDVFSFLERGQLTVDQARKTLDEGFALLADHLKKSGDIATQAFLDLIRLNKQFGLESAQVAQWIRDMTAQFGGGAAAYMTYIFDKYQITGSKTGTKQKLTDFMTEYKGLEDEIKTLQERLDDLRITMYQDGDKTPTQRQLEEEAELVQEIAEKTATLNGMRERAQKAAEEAGPELYRLATLILGQFNAAIAAGGELYTVLMDLAPALDPLLTFMESTGFDFKENPAFKEFMEFYKRAKDNKPLLDAAAGLNQMALAMANIPGAMTKEAFASLSKMGQDLYNDMIKAGFTEQQALAAIAPLLNTLIQLAGQYGFTIDDATLALIENASKYGLIKGKSLDVVTVLIQGFAAILEALGKDIPQAWLDFLNTVKTNPLPNPWPPNPNPNPNPGPAPGPEPTPQPQVSGPGPIYGNVEAVMGDGGLVRRPTVALVGERGPELVTPLDELYGGVGTREELHVHYNITTMDSKGVEQFMAEKGLPAIQRLWQNNSFKHRSRSRETLGVD